MLSVICYAVAALAVIGWSPEERHQLALITFTAAFLFQRAVVRPVTGIVYAAFLFPTLYVIIEVAGYPDFDPVATPVTFLIVWAAASALVDAVQEWIVQKAKAAVQAVRNAVRCAFVAVVVHPIHSVVAFLIKGVVQALAILLVVVPCTVAHGVAATVRQTIPERVLVTIAASRPYRAVAFVISKIVAMAGYVVSFLVADARESAATLAEELHVPDWVLRAATGVVVDDAATPEGAERAPDADGPEAAEHVAASVNENVNEGVAAVSKQANNNNTINKNSNSTAAAATNVAAPAAPQAEIRLRRLRAPPPPGGRVDDDDDIADLLPPIPPFQAPPPPRGARHAYVGDPPSNGNSNGQQEAAAVAAALSEFDFHAHCVAALAASRAASTASNGNRTGDSGLDDVTALMSPEALAVATMNYDNGVGAASVASSSSSSSPTIPTIPTPHVQPPHVHQQQQQQQQEQEEEEEEASSPLPEPGSSDFNDPFHADDVDSNASLLPAGGDEDNSESVEATDDKAIFFCESSPRSVLPAALSSGNKKKRKIDGSSSSSSVAAKSDAGADREGEEIEEVGPPSKKARTSDPATATATISTATTATKMEKKTGRPRSSNRRAAPKRSSSNVRGSADDNLCSSNVATTKSEKEETTNPCTSFSSKPAVPAPPQQLPAVPPPKKKKMVRAEIRAAAKRSYDEHVQSEPAVVNNNAEPPQPQLPTPPPRKKARRTTE
jgi:hypothetical protein